MTFPWGDGRRFNSYNRFVKEQFGGRIQKIALDAGFTCPNRDGTSGEGGCTFCVNNAFNPSYCSQHKSISQQLEDGIQFHNHRRRPSKIHLAYFQAYSNTYAPLEHLQKLYEEALSFPSVAGLIIATRPDCLDKQTLEYLAELQERTFITLEIGMESCRNATLERINRGHTIECTIQAIEMAHEFHIPVGTHLIFGLSGEKPEDWLCDRSIINRLPLHSIKFHQLQIIKGTKMEQEFLSSCHDFHRMSCDEYVSFIADYISGLSPEIIIERFISEVPSKYLATRNWGGMTYEQILQKIECKLEEKDIWQGKFKN